MLRRFSATHRNAVFVAWCTAAVFRGERSCATEEQPLSDAGPLDGLLQYKLMAPVVPEVVLVGARCAVPLAEVVGQGLFGGVRCGGAEVVVSDPRDDGPP